MPESASHNTFLGNPQPRYGVLKAVVSPSDLIHLHVIREHLQTQLPGDVTDDDVVRYALYAAARMVVVTEGVKVFKRKGK